ncbi:MAG: hypothetical protein U0359_17380 [Byssovorax sp.]
MSASVSGCSTPHRPERSAQRRGCCTGETVITWAPMDFAVETSTSAHAAKPACSSHRSASLPPAPPPAGGAPPRLATYAGPRARSVQTR